VYESPAGLCLIFSSLAARRGFARARIGPHCRPAGPPTDGGWVQGGRSPPQWRPHADPGRCVRRLVPDGRGSRTPRPITQGCAVVPEQPSIWDGRGVHGRARGSGGSATRPRLIRRRRVPWHSRHHRAPCRTRRRSRERPHGVGAQRGRCRRPVRRAARTARGRIRDRNRAIRCA
jgi:hypothetical protein